jgi:hypothetical protein
MDATTTTRCDMLVIAYALVIGAATSANILDSAGATVSTLATMADIGRTVRRRNARASAMSTPIATGVATSRARALFALSAGLCKDGGRSNLKNRRVFQWELDGEIALSFSQSLLDALHFVGGHRECDEANYC